MDRRSFLKLFTLIPFTKEIVQDLIEPIEDDFWSEDMEAFDLDSIPDNFIIGGVDVAEPIFAPSLTKIGAFDVVAHSDGHAWGEPDEMYWTNERRAALLECDCYPGLEIQIKTGKCDESENLLDL